MDLIAPAPPTRCSRAELRVLRSAVDRRLKALLPVPRPGNALDEALHYGLLAPGKRIRPLLTILAAWEFGPDDLAALDAGCALEMVHAASLILDDLPAMDDAKLRRGQPALHVAFGEDVALLTAITLLSRAFATLAGAADVEAAIRCDLVAILGRTVGTEGLASGQYLDLRAMASGLPAHQIADSNHLKTGILFVAAVEMAAAVAGVAGPRVEAMRRFATHLGQAFQILDDLVDGTGTQPDGGLDGGEDSGKINLVALLGRGEGELRLARHVDEALAELRPGSALGQFVRAIFASVGALERIA